MDDALRFALNELRYDCGGVTDIVDDTVTILSTVGKSDGMLPGTKIPLANSLAEFVVRCADVWEVNNLPNSRWRHYPAVRSMGLASVVVMPIAVGSAVYGTFYLASRTVRTSALTYADKNFIRLVAALLGSMIERKRQEEKLDSLAFSDILTGLPNRASIVERLERSIVEADGRGASFSILYLDLDRFKEINDRAGHAIGDAILRSCAQRMQQCIAPSDTIGRFGGDEFVVIQAAGSDGDVAASLADCLAASLVEPFAVDDVHYDVGLSVGISVYPADGRNPAVLLESADKAMYCAKRRKRAAPPYVVSTELLGGTAG